MGNGPVRRPPRVIIMLRLARRALMWLGLVLMAFVSVLGIYVARNWDRTWDVPAPDLHASSDPAIIARGEYLATGPAHCTECHVSTSRRSSGSMTRARSPWH